jgi:four helix bundle protein
MERKNINRGFTKLRVRNDVVELYVLTCSIISKFPFELKKTAGNCIDCSQSISRNIAEGYCRKSIREYFNFLNIALGSSGEYRSCIYSFNKANQVSDEQLDQLHFKTENELIQRVKSIQIKMKMVNGTILSNNIYPFQYSIFPSFHD